MDLCPGFAPVPDLGELCMVAPGVAYKDLRVMRDSVGNQIGISLTKSIQQLV